MVGWLDDLEIIWIDSRMHKGRMVGRPVEWLDG